jgi:DNA-binding MarR family transcriptional regulator
MDMSDLAFDRLASANQIRRRLADFHRQMRALRDAHGVSASKLSVLGRLQRAGLPLSATQLAQLEKLQPQSLTRIIAELTNDGLIVRRQNESDRRHLDIEISEKGRELLFRDAFRQNQWLAGAMEEKLSPAERAVLALAVEMLERLGGPDPTIYRGS